MIKFIKFVVGRIKLYIHRREWPWSVRWMNLLSPGIFYSPVKILRLIGPLMRNEISLMSCGLQLYGEEGLKDILQACRGVGIKPFLAYGSLLGYYREKKFIYGDNDIDFGIFENDRSKLLALTKEMQAKGYELRKHTDILISFRKKKFLNFGIDLYINFRYKEDNILYCAGDGKEGSGDIFLYPFSSKSFDDFKEVVFMKSKVFIPVGTEDYLVSIYGINWRVPISDCKLDIILYYEKAPLIYPNRIMVKKEDFEKGNFTLKVHGD